MLIEFVVVFVTKYLDFQETTSWSPLGTMTKFKLRSANTKNRWQATTIHQETITCSHIDKKKRKGRKSSKSILFPHTTGSLHISYCWTTYQVKRYKLQEHIIDKLIWSQDMNHSIPKLSQLLSLKQIPLWLEEILCLSLRYLHSDKVQMKVPSLQSFAFFGCLLFVHFPLIPFLFDYGELSRSTGRNIIRAIQQCHDWRQGNKSLSVCIFLQRALFWNVDLLCSVIFMWWFLWL